MFDTKYKKTIDKIKINLAKYELPVIIFWSIAPVLPTDLICYIAGTLRINIYKCLLGIFIGEGFICAVYIFGGKFLLNSLLVINF